MESGRSAGIVEGRGAVWQAAIFPAADCALAGIERETGEAAVVGSLFAGKQKSWT
jgi:hypothetical protein